MRITYRCAAAIAVAAVVLSACATKKLGRLGDSCASDQDCASGVCYDQQCWPGASQVQVAVALHDASAAPDIVRGGTASVDLDVQVTGPFLKPVKLALEGAPPGVTGTFDPAQLQASAPVKLAIVVAADATPGTYPLKVTGASGPYANSVAFDLVVSPPPEKAKDGDACGSDDDCQSGKCFEGVCWPANMAMTLVIAADAPGAATTPGGDAGTTLSLTVAGTPVNPVAFSLSSAPPGVTAGFNPADPVASAKISLTLHVGQAVALGGYAITVKAKAGPYVADVDVPLKVVKALATIGEACAADGDCESGKCWGKKCWPNDVAIALAASAGAVPLAATAGTSAQTKMDLTVTGTPLDLVVFSMTGAPAGATATFDPPNESESGTVTVSVSLGASVKPGQYAVKAVAATGPYSGELGLVLKVLGLPGDACVIGEDCESGICSGLVCWPANGWVSLVVPSDQGSPRANPGDTLKVEVDVSTSGDMPAPVVLSAQLPNLTGFTATFDPGTLTAPGKSTMTLQVAADASGPYEIRAIGKWGPWDGYAVVALTVRAGLGAACAAADDCVSGDCFVDQDCGSSCLASMCWPTETALDVAGHGHAASPWVADGGSEDAWLDVSVTPDLPIPTTLTDASFMTELHGTFDPSQVTASGPVRVAVAATSGTAAGDLTMTLAARAGPVKKTFLMPVHVLPAMPNGTLESTADTLALGAVAMDRGITLFGGTNDGAWAAIGYDMMLARYDPGGVLQGPRLYGTTGDEQIVGLAPDPAVAGAAVIMGTDIEGAGVPFVAYLDRFGEPGWAVSLVNGSTSPLTGVPGAVVPFGGDFVVAGALGSEVTTPVVIGLSAAGDAKWAYEYSGDVRAEDLKLAAWNGPAFSGISTACDGRSLVRLDGAGSPLWGKCVAVGSNFGALAGDASGWVVADASIVPGVVDTGATMAATTFAGVDDGGAVTWATRVGPKWEYTAVTYQILQDYVGVAMAPDGVGFLMRDIGASGSGRDLLIVKLGADHKVAWARRLTISPRVLQPISITATDKGFVVIAASEMLASRIAFTTSYVIVYVAFDGTVVSSPLALADAAADIAEQPFSVTPTDLKLSKSVFPLQPASLPESLVRR